MKRRIVIEITSLIEVPFVSGIQRVVREILVRMLDRQNEEISVVLLAFSVLHKAFLRIPCDAFIAVYRDRRPLPGRWSDEVFDADGMGAGDIFLDLDSVWNNRMRRSFLLPVLKSKGVRIASLIYDIIPILFPDYCDAETTVRFMDYVGAHLQYDDLLIANTKSTLSDIHRLCESVGLPDVPGVCVPLGSDFALPASGRREDPASDQSTGNAGADRAAHRTEPSLPEEPILRGKYLLCVGTVEPRKNHAFLLDLFEKHLRDMQIGLVIAGRPGWNVEPIMKRILDLASREKNFVYLPSADDAWIASLYKNAFFTVFPTVYEGYGLPIIESICRNTPVIATDLPVLREVGGEFCEYFPLSDEAAICRILLQYEKNPETYASKKASLRDYHPFTWEMSEKELWDAVMKLF